MSENRAPLGFFQDHKIRSFSDSSYIRGHVDDGNR
jgi:hypothetical protein